jgi:hypothetical protein
MWTKGNRNAFHGFEAIVDRVKNTWGIPWTRGSLVGAGFLEERGRIPLEITKKCEGNLEPPMESPILLVGGVWEKEESNEESRTSQRGFIPGAPGLSGKRTELVQWRLGPDFSDVGRTYPVGKGISDLEIVPEILAIYNLVLRP